MARTAELEVQSIAAGGDGVARTEGMVVFLPRSAPGDRVLATIDARRRFARARVERILAPSPLRVEPPCRHYVEDDCGGCQLQHLDYGAQLDAKSTIIGDAFTRIARRAIDPPTVRASEAEWRYRTKLTLTMWRDAGRWTIGLHPYHDPVGVFQLEDCPITDGRVVAVWREIFAAAELLPSARSLRGAVRLVDDGGDATAVVQGGTSWPRRQEFFAQVPSLAALWWQPDERPRALVAERRPAPAGASFAQVNPLVAAHLREHVVSRVLSHAPATVADVYAGSGDTAAPIAASGARVTAIELDRAAAAVCASRLPSGSTALAGRAEDLLPRALPADVVLLNPPRSGVHERIPAMLEEARGTTRSLIYVSCDPATLARDVARLAGYRVAAMTAFDMFPQTAHVETVCELVPEGA